jgi:predicted DNA-binding transcriptional regulator AlpA
MAEIININDRRGPEPCYVAPTRVRSMREAAALAGISIATLYRAIANGHGPRTIRMSPRRRGILEHDLTAWLESCASNVEINN